MNRHHQSRIMTILLFVTVLLALAAPFNHTAAHAQILMSRVRFLHAVPGAPNINVYLDGTVIASDLAFANTTPLLQVAGNTHLVTLRQSGLGTDAPALIEMEIILDANYAFTVVIQGTPEAIEAVPYEDFLDELAVGMARLTVINAVADSTSLDVLTSEGEPLLQGISYGVQFSSINVGAGLYNLLLTPAGGSLDSIADIGPVALHGGTLHTIVALGSLKDGVSPLILTTPVNTKTDEVRIRFIQGAPDASAVDVYLNDTLIAPALALGEMTNHIALPAETYTLALRPAGSPATVSPLITTDVALDSGMPPQTITLLNQTSDNSLILQTFTDDITGITPEKARISVINAIPDSTITAELTDTPATVLAPSLASNTQSIPVDVAAGEYLISANIQNVTNPVNLVVPSEAYHGGVYYTVLVYGGGTSATPYITQIASTEINVTSASLLSLAPVAAVAETTDALPTEQPPVSPTEPEAQPPVETESAPLPAQNQSELVVEQPTQPPTQATPQPLLSQNPKPLAYIELNPGANLHCRELPGAEKRSLGLIPSDATLTVIGRTGTPLVPETGNPTPRPTPEVDAVEDLWLAVQWDPPTGGYLRCWVSAQYLRIEFRGKLLDTLEELMELPEEPFNRPGEVVGADVQPPTPLFNSPLAMVELGPGVSLQLRRTPQTNSESLSLVPAGAQLEVIGYAAAPSEGLIGQPTDPNWVYVRYRTEDGGAFVGWVSAQYVSLTYFERPIEITDLEIVETSTIGYYEPSSDPPQIPVEQQDIVGVVNLNPGANLNLRNRPSADALVIVGIPNASSMIINGRNGDGSWVQVTYEATSGPLDGWTAAQYLLITRGGQTWDIAELPILTDEEDAMTG